MYKLITIFSFKMRKKSTRKNTYKKKSNLNPDKPKGYKFTKKMGMYLFAAPSKTGNKKYDAFVKMNGKYKKVASFGDRNYQHYKDRIGYYKSKDHGDSERRRRYQIRHKKDLKTDKAKAKISAGFFSMKYLW